MSDRANSELRERTDADARPEQADGAETVERYEVDDGVVFYDAENPLAWMEASRTVYLHEFA